MYDYAIRFEQDDNATGIAVFCRDLPELNSYGDDREHAIREASDAIETTLSLYVDLRRPIPEASPAKEGEHVVHLPAVTVAKIAIWNEMMRLGMKKAELCRRLGVSQTIGDRLVDFTHTSKMEQLEKALDALNASIRVSPADPEWINLPYGGGQAGFYVGRLIDELQQRPRGEMLVGAVAGVLGTVNPDSLDYFLRTRYAKRPDTMQAVREVIDDLVATGKIEHIPKQSGVPAGLIRLK
ncbi:type II toxin-antitoxin system HicB family antitoxin [Pseudomonas iranensis]|uniref:type II toxin-antitoxin system HicB family antitoxin n=1 Tax=Pseudomonas iranensis TaxID=2745503 RepID=UPI001646D67F|nr:type II toxin-antitoxin system HicB family antitoxin [Pseudomonas iranensis]